jgi:hypothetical protein
MDDRSPLSDSTYWAEVAGDQRDRMDSRLLGYDVQRVYALETQADLHALRAIGCSDAIVFVVRVASGFKLSPNEHPDAVTRWTRRGCTTLNPITPLVEIR